MERFIQLGNFSLIHPNSKLVEMIKMVIMIINKLISILEQIIDYHRDSTIM